uniref:transcription factor GTE4-like n=1 Tax=Erigeron canadensis TaxID=72917 RepID=UPI001CB9B049|nr:transcription factor GTE4-like [Erigeron canadensis]XP_043619141.1 transcription factor GTE4-like [Erigeron canadensis]
MASGILLDADKIIKEKSKWGEGNKVYVRKFKRTADRAPTVGVVSPAPDRNTDQNLVVENGNCQQQETLSLATAAPTDTVTAVSPPAEMNEDRNFVVDDGNHEKQQTLSRVVELSNDYTGQSGITGNGVVKPVFALVDGVVKINIKSATSKNELLELKEKLRGEVDRIRRLGRKLEDKEAELTAFSTVVGGGGDDGDGQAYSHEQFSGSNIVDRRALLRVNSEMGTDYMDRRALMRMNSEVGSVPNGDLRPFRQLSVSVMNNNHGIGEVVEKRTPKANQLYQNSEFLLGKDRLPPESNKRHKPGRPGRKPKGYYTGEESHRNQMYRSCNSLLQRLMKHKHGWVFNEPVKAKLLGLHDYFDIIKHPMDLGTVKSRLAQNFYKSPNEFADDVRLTFHNAMTYNPKGQDVHVMAENLLNIFEERWAVIDSGSYPEMRYGMIYDASTPTPTSRKVPHFAHAPSRMLYRSESVNMPSMTKPITPKPAPPPRTPVPKKPKAKDPNKRNMTYEEKQKLSTNLQSLPSDKLDNIVQIIKKKNTSLSQHDDEIEVDIDSVDIETLWELDRFVQNHKKYVSKHKRKAELAQQARAEAGDANRVVPQNPAATIPEVPNGNKANEKTLANTPLDQGERRGENASRSSSSSSSSSDSGTSSSDSDSDSSSEDGSPRN